MGRRSTPPAAVRRRFGNTQQKTLSNSGLRKINVRLSLSKLESLELRNPGLGWDSRQRPGCLRPSALPFSPASWSRTAAADPAIASWLRGARVGKAGDQCTGAPPEASASAPPTPIFKEGWETPVFVFVFLKLARCHSSNINMLLIIRKRGKGILAKRPTVF